MMIPWNSLKVRGFPCVFASIKSFKTRSFFDLRNCFHGDFFYPRSSLKLEVFIQFSAIAGKHVYKNVAKALLVHFIGRTMDSLVSRPASRASATLLSTVVTACNYMQLGSPKVIGY